MLKQVDSQTKAAVPIALVLAKPNGGCQNSVHAASIVRRRFCLGVVFAVGAGGCQPRLTDLNINILTVLDVYATCQPIKH
jgi:hypothetical protein